jgi:hypothetical protein
MARGDTIDITGMHTETYDAPSELIHDHEHPVALQVNGFTPKQVNAPEAILQIASVSGMIAPACQPVIDWCNLQAILRVSQEAQP